MSTLGGKYSLELNKKRRQQQQAVEDRNNYDKKEPTNNKRIKISGSGGEVVGTGLFTASRTTTTSQDRPDSGTKEKKLDDEMERLHQENTQLALRCTLLEQQNKLLKSKEVKYTSFIRTTLERVMHMESHLSLLEKHQKQPGPVSKIPDEMIFCVFSQLSLMDIIWAQSVCKSWNYAITIWLKQLDLFPFYNGVNNQTLQKISKFSNIQSLSLTRCKEITNRGLSVIAKAFPLLVHLDLFGCQINDFLTLGELKFLKNLRIGDSKLIVDKDLEDLPPLLESLKIEWCMNIKNGGLYHLWNMSKLTTLYVGQCDFLRSGTLPDSVAHSLTDLTYDRQMRIFYDEAMVGLQACTNLRKLYLYSLPVQETTIRMLSSLQKLEYLKFNRCFTLTDEGLHYITITLTNLTALELRGDSNITNTGLRYLSNLTPLQTLRLRCGKKVNDEGLEFLTHLSLSKLHLCDCFNITNETLRLIANTQANTLKKLVFSQSGSITNAFVLLYLSRLTNLTRLKLTDCIHVSGLFWNSKIGGGLAFVERVDVRCFNY